MKVPRLYSDSKGISTWDEVEIACPQVETGLEISETLHATGISFRFADPGDFDDWHHAPARQFVVVMSGALEIMCGDLSVRAFPTGSILLIEDVDGGGHRTRGTGTDRRLTLNIPVDGAIR